MEEKAPKPTTKRDVAQRWTEDLVSDGWTPVADTFLKCYAELQPEVTTPEAMFVIHLILHKWDKRMPFPAFKTLGKRMGVTAAAARRHARSLEKKQYLIRKMRIGETNEFDLRPLFVALEKHKNEHKLTPTRSK